MPNLSEDEKSLLISLLNEKISTLEYSIAHLGDANGSDAARLRLCQQARQKLVVS